MRLPALFRTTVFQLTLVYMALFGASVLALFTFIYWSTLGYLERQTEEIIEAEIRGLAEQAERRGLVGLANVIDDRVRRDTEDRSVYLLVDAALRPVAGNLPYWPEQFDRRGEWVDFLKSEGSGRYTPVRALVLGVGPGFRLLVGRDIRELEQINEVFRRASVWGIGLTMGLSLLGGVLIGFSAQRRLAQINRTTRQIIAGNLKERVPVTGGGDEHDELAENVNAMLDQIETLMAGLRHVGDSVAHDLRGPLTRLRARLETLASEPAPSREGLDECVAQADALLATFNALLRIARIESGAYRSAFAPVDLGRIARDVCELYQAAADERRIDLHCETPREALVVGDRELLAQALTNLLDNAVKYTPDGGRIEITVEAAEASRRPAQALRNGETEASRPAQSLRDRETETSRWAPSLHDGETEASRPAESLRDGDVEASRPAESLRDDDMEALRPAQVRLADTAAPRPAYVLRVADTGSGIPAHERERVLERFTRLDRSRSLPGNGLGLALVKAVAEQHDARLTLGDNRPGLVVELEVPAAGAPPAAARASRESARGPQ